MYVSRGKVIRYIKNRALFFALALGTLAGIGTACAVGVLPAKEELAGGYLRVFEFSLGAVFSRALFLQVLPVLVFYLFAFGALALPASAAVLFMRGFAGGAGCTLLFRVCVKNAAFPPLFALSCVFELTVMLLCHSCGKLSVYFSEALRKGARKRALLRFTGDLLFFAGLIFLFYLLRGCILALLLRT